METQVHRRLQFHTIGAEAIQRALARVYKGVALAAALGCLQEWRNQMWECHESSSSGLSPVGHVVSDLTLREAQQVLGLVPAGTLPHGPEHGRDTI